MNHEYPSRIFRTQTHCPTFQLIGIAWSVGGGVGSTDLVRFYHFSCSIAYIVTSSTTCSNR